MWHVNIYIYMITLHADEVTFRIWAVTTCGGESHAPSPSPCDKVMLSPAAQAVWTGCCRYDNAAGNFTQVPVTESETPVFQVQSTMF